jgi:hypothetical protein
MAGAAHVYFIPGHVCVVAFGQKKVVCSAATDDALRSRIDMRGPNPRAMTSELVSRSLLWVFEVFRKED